MSENLIGVVPEVTHKNVFKLKDYEPANYSYPILNVQIRTNLETNLPISLRYNLEPINMDDGILYAALLLSGLYILIVFEVRIFDHAFWLG